MLKREQSSSCNTHIPVTLVQKQEKAKSSVPTCGKSNIEQFFNLRFATTVKNPMIFRDCISSLASSIKLVIFKADETQMVEISWESSDSSNEP